MCLVLFCIGSSDRMVTSPEIQISPADKEKIDKLRELVQEDLTPYYDTPFNLLRWIQGHPDEDLQNIATKLRGHLKFRKCYWDVDKMHLGKRDHPIHHYLPAGITGLSGKNDNLIVNIEQAGRTDYAGVLDNFSLMEVVKARVYDLEVMLAEVMALEKKTGKQAWILFVADISCLEYNRKLYDLATKAMRSLAEFMAEHYVEMIKNFVSVNVPMFAWALYKVVRPLLPQRTAQKIIVLSSKWRNEILNYADGNRLPVEWNDKEHNYFSAKLVLPKPYSSLDTVNYEIPSNAETVCIPSGKRHILSVTAKAGDILSLWLHFDSSYALAIYKAKDGEEEYEEYEDMEVLMPVFRNAPGGTNIPIEEKLTAKEDGVYRIYVYNQNSFWYSLTATVLFEVKR